MLVNTGSSKGQHDSWVRKLYLRLYSCRVSHETNTRLFDKEKQMGKNPLFNLYSNKTCIKYQHRQFNGITFHKYILPFADSTSKTVTAFYPCSSAFWSSFSTWSTSCSSWTPPSESSCCLRTLLKCLVRFCRRCFISFSSLASSGDTRVWRTSSTMTLVFAVTFSSLLALSFTCKL